MKQNERWSPAGIKLPARLLARIEAGCFSFTRLLCILMSKVWILPKKKKKVHPVFSMYFEAVPNFLFWMQMYFVWRVQQWDGDFKAGRQQNKVFKNSWEPETLGFVLLLTERWAVSAEYLSLQKVESPQQPECTASQQTDKRSRWARHDVGRCFGFGSRTFMSASDLKALEARNQSHFWSAVSGKERDPSDLRFASVKTQQTTGSWRGAAISSAIVSLWRCVTQRGRLLLSRSGFQLTEAFERTNAENVHPSLHRRLISVLSVDSFSPSACFEHVVEEAFLFVQRLPREEPILTRRRAACSELAN